MIHVHRLRPHCKTLAESSLSRNSCICPHRYPIGVSIPAVPPFPRCRCRDAECDSMTWRFRNPHPPASPKTATAAAPARQSTPDLPPRPPPLPLPLPRLYPANTPPLPQTAQKNTHYAPARDAHNPPSRHNQLSRKPPRRKVDPIARNMYPLFFPPQLAATAPHVIAAPECFRTEVDYADTCRRYAAYGGERVFRRPRPCRCCGDPGLGERCDCSEDSNLEPGDVEVSIHRSSHCYYTPRGSTSDGRREGGRGGGGQDLR